MRFLAGSAAASAGMAGAAQAAEPALVPDLAPLLTTHNDVEPAPAPEAPPVESSFTAFGPDEPLKQLRDFTPAGAPASGLVEAVQEAPKKITHQVERPPSARGAARIVRGSWPMWV